MKGSKHSAEAAVFGETLLEGYARFDRRGAIARSGERSLGSSGEGDGELGALSSGETAEEGVRVRPSAAGDVDEMVRLWRACFGEDVFGGEGAWQEQFDWAYERNPHRHAKSVFHWIGEWGGGVASVWSSMPVRLSVCGRVLAGCWIQNAAVARSARRSGIGRKVLRCILGAHELGLGVGLVPASRGLGAAEGMIFVRADCLGVLRLRAGDVLREVARALRHRKFGRAMTLAAGLGRRARGLVSSASDSAIEVVEVARFDPSLDALLGEIGEAIPVLVQRDHRRLNWLLGNPRMQCRAFLATRSDEPCGYALVRSDGLILDLLAHSSDAEALGALFRCVEAWAVGSGVRRLVGILPGVPDLCAAYRRVGFIHEDGVDFGLFHAPVESAELSAVLGDPKNWYVSFGDSDLWAFGLEKPVAQGERGGSAGRA